MRLRKPEKRDAQYMLEWMQDDDIVRDLGKGFSSMTLADCIRFIENSATDDINVHKVITDDRDIYMGTVSLKNIDTEHGSAELGIVMRKEAMGKGYASYALREIIKTGKACYDLKYIYWYHKSRNKRAQRFYEKNGQKKVSFDKIEQIAEGVSDSPGEFIWYIWEA